MSSLAELPEVVGFFSYSREDDADSHGALSALRTRIQGELRGQLGRAARTLRLWQDKEAISSGTLWEREIKTAVAQSVFFVPIITPTVVASPYCKFELESFLEREAALGRDNLVFPILYIDVPALDDPVRRRNDPVLALIAERQYVDWREFRYLKSNATEVKRSVGRFCSHVRDALQQPWISPEKRKQQEAEAGLQQAGVGHQRELAKAKPRDAEERRRVEEAKARERIEEERRRRAAEAERRDIADAEAAQAKNDPQRVARGIPVEVGLPGISEVRFLVPGAGKTEWFRDLDVGPEMVVVPAGSFVMGSPEFEENRTQHEGSQHKVSFAKPFAVGRFAVTFDDWDACVTDGEDHPIADHMLDVVGHHGQHESRKLRAIGP
jgi:hypothetical protein